ncbi:hypothetical protein GYH30_013223 [Glycine max]|uniref:Uncharacterized protein n=1 Tax=Glycine max TaxID=3847 RepID=A0A0R0K4F3_SOYBN|nr:hypothetical protein GYH30_013223 [Glycine max]
MVQLCFVLDLRRLTPPLLTDIKQSLLSFLNSAIASFLIDRRFLNLPCLHFQSLLQLANFYANSSSSSSHACKSVTFGDKIGLCSERVLYSWRGKDIERKVIVITSTVPEDVDSMVQKSLMEMLEKISADFLPQSLAAIWKRVVIENSVRVGEKIILFLPSFYNSLKLLQISLSINITVNERINSASLDEGLIMGASFVVIPSSYHVIETISDDANQSDLNVQLFRSLSSFLHSMNQGLVCSSNCDLETMAEAPYHCYYILQPSDIGPMLMRLLAGAEEILRVPDNQLVDSSINKEIESSVQAYVEFELNHLTDYDPLLHERGFHKKLNVLVKESLQFGSVFSKSEDAFSELSSSQQPSSEVIGKAEAATGVIVDEETLALDITDQDDKTTACITEEWKQLVVSEDPKLYSPSCMPKAKLGQSSVSPRDGNRQLDRETSRILETLECARKEASYTEQVFVGSQLMKPNFQRQKRKHR